MRGAAILVIFAACGRFGFDENPADVPDPPDDGLVRITIEIDGTGGLVTGPDAFTCATGTCVLDVLPGTTVKLRGLAATDSWFAGWRGPCGGNFACEIVIDADVTVRAEFLPTPNRVFVTSTKTDAAFGGLAGGDAICSERAAAAGLQGTFIAYLSDSVTDAPSRLSTSRGFIRTDGAPFADAPADFATGELLFPVRLDEYGNDLGDRLVYTGTDRGTKTAELCADWTSADNGLNGSVNEVKFAFDLPRSWGLGCGNPTNLLCVETGRVVPVLTRPDTGRRAFMSSNGWVPGGGRDSADAHCASEATIAGMPGTFLAALATTTASIASRFPDDAIYRRADDVRLRRDAGMWTAEWLDVPPELDQFGDLVSNDYWTGANRLDLVGAPSDNCSDWTDGSDTATGYMHWTTNSDLRAAWKTETCNKKFPVLCLEN